ncbi:hypothetical protein IQ07DRAFT_115753 [Pyrenochaeta sp. DS3sAY3a]|nr:hypothetical protein IQ07DRAFT_115753 [Pyrenochaeta sp. DS3sAY3a]
MHLPAASPQAFTPDTPSIRSWPKTWPHGPTGSRIGTAAPKKLATMFKSRKFTAIYRARKSCLFEQFTMTVSVRIFCTRLGGDIRGSRFRQLGVGRKCGRRMTLGIGGAKGEMIGGVGI